MTEVDVHVEAIESQSWYPASRPDGSPWREDPFNVRVVAFWGPASSALMASHTTYRRRRQRQVSAARPSDPGHLDGPQPVEFECDTAAGLHGHRSGRSSGEHELP